jgi:hypothetical protein
MRVCVTAREVRRLVIPFAGCSSVGGFHRNISEGRGRLSGRSFNPYALRASSADEKYSNLIPARPISRIRALRTCGSSQTTTRSIGTGSLHSCTLRLNNRARWNRCLLSFGSACVPSLCISRSARGVLKSLKIEHPADQEVNGLTRWSARLQFQKSFQGTRKEPLGAAWWTNCSQGFWIQPAFGAGMTPNCWSMPNSSELPQRSTILPSLNFDICMPRIFIFLPVGGIPMRDPLCVPVKV